MKLPRRSFFSNLFLCLPALLLLASLNYWNGLRSVNETCAQEVQQNLNQLTFDIDRRVQLQEIEIRRLVTSRAVSEYFSTSARNGAAADLAASLAALVGQRGGPFRLSLFDKDRVLRIQAERPLDAADGTGVIVRTKDFRSLVVPADGSSWQHFSQLPHTATWRFVALSDSRNDLGLNAAMLGELDLSELLQERSIGSSTGSAAGSNSLAYVAWDKDGRIVSHTQRSFIGQSIRSTMPLFATVAQSRSDGVFQQVDANQDILFAFTELPRLNIIVAVGRDRSTAAGSAHRWGISGIILATLLAFVIALAIQKNAQRKMTGLARVNEGLTAVAKGELDHRVELRSTDDARSMADNLNVLTERMRTQYAREAEARQFESFFRLSAMLTHDLKNAIEALSLIVGNMERHFHNEQFRVDAMKSLSIATDKLRNLVARLSRPVSSLSGEHKLPREIDLVPILRRVFRTTAEPAGNQHKIDLRLPTELKAVVDVDRIEQVFENLIINALEAMSQKPGTLTIEAKKNSDGKATVIISDTGSGMSEHFIRESLFRPFRTTKIAGVGLGLYTCREVVGASGGSLEVESKEGFGTTFRVVLPSADQ